MAESLIPPKAKLLVCVGPNPGCADLVRAANNLAGALQAEWYTYRRRRARMRARPQTMMQAQAKASPIRV
jgi:K+-sensing histidine kinase KdpD